MTSSYSAPSSAAKKPFAAARSAAWATGARRVACRYARMFGVYGNVDVVAPTSAPMLEIVASPEEQGLSKVMLFRPQTHLYMIG